MRRNPIGWAFSLLLLISGVAQAAIPDRLTWPLPGQPDETRISDYLGTWWKNSYCPGTAIKYLHTGLDLAALSGTKVYAIYGGRVTVRQVYSGSSAYNSFVTLTHGSGSSAWTSNYTHIIPLSLGSTVVAGQQIGSVAGNNPGGNHLHLTVRDRPYSNISNRGRLPRTACVYQGVLEPAYPEYFKDPSDLDWIWR